MYVEVKRERDEQWREEEEGVTVFPILLFRIYVRRLQAYATASKSEIKSGVHQGYRCDMDTLSLNAKSQ